MAQISIGMLFTTVPNFATAMITEGVGDMITCFRGITSRSFKLKDYCAQKSISLAISLYQCGLKDVKDGLNAVGKECSNIKTEVQNVLKLAWEDPSKLIGGSLDDTAIVMGS